MKFYSSRDLRTEIRSIWQDIDDGEYIVLTNNGKPKSLMLKVEETDLEETLLAIRQAKALMAINSIRENIKGKEMSIEEIDEEIKLARQESDLC